jgi:uncharacterized membrane protein YtjA (UPF0391 family)
MHKGNAMLQYVAIFVVLAAVAVMIGFTDRNAEALEMAKVLFIALHLLFVGALLLLGSRITGDAPQK